MELKLQETKTETEDMGLKMIERDIRNSTIICNSIGILPYNKFDEQANRLFNALKSKEIKITIGITCFNKSVS